MQMNSAAWHGGCNRIMGGSKGDVNKWHKEEIEHWAVQKNEGGGSSEASCVTVTVAKAH